MSDPFDTAMGLLLGDGAPREDVQRAGELFEEASAQGHAEASERCAMFEAFGMARPQSWARALDFLETAARQGSRSAGEQLLLLSDDSRDPQFPKRAGDQFWSSVRARINIADRVQPGEKVALFEAPRIRLIRRFASPAECRWLVEMTRHRLAPATVFDQATGQQMLHSARDNTHLVLGIGEMNVFTEVIRNRISAATRLPVPLFEPSQMLHYGVGEKFKAHYDFIDPANPAYLKDLARFGQRIATFLIYLNSGYAGGETSFPEIGLNFRGETGDALFFANVARDGQPDRQTLHAGLPPTAGEKWVFSQWIRDRFPAT